MTLTRETITRAANTYLDTSLDAVRRSDVEALVATYVAEGASFEDPIGSGPMRGDAIRAFYGRPRDVLFLQRLGKIAISSYYAGFTFPIAIKRPDETIHAFIHERMRFDDEGKVVSMVAIPDFLTGGDLAGAFPEVHPEPTDTW